MSVEDDIKEVAAEQHEFSEEDELEQLKRKKILTAVVAVFLVILVISYFIPGSHVLSIIGGQLTSPKLNQDFTAELDNGGKVVFDKEVYEELKQFYFAEQKNEFKVCLEGRKEGKNYYVSGLKTPTIFTQSFSHVSSELCDEDTIISLHTHPYKQCIFSEQDVRSYEAVRKINPDAITGLMCETDRFNFYGY